MERLIKLCSLMSVCLFISSCASILNKTNEQPIVEDPASRTMGEIIDDKSIQTWVEVNILKKNDLFDDMNVEVLSFNAKVLLIGQVSTEALKQQASDAALESPKVKTVHNELTVQPPISASAIASDVILTGQIKSQMYLAEGFASRKIKVVTENGVVYLMGLVKQSTAIQAVNIVKKVSGVQKVVRVFEIVP
jgi:osmotically-inducible protein OsmY